MSTKSRFPHEPVFKPKGRRVAYHQVHTLFDFLIDNPDLAVWNPKSTEGRYKSAKAWETIAGILNRIPGGCRKDGKAWSAYWSNYKNKLKTRIQRIRVARKKGQQPDRNLTEFDNKVLPILGPMFGCESLSSDPEDEVAEVNSSPLGFPLSPAAPLVPHSPPVPRSPLVPRGSPVPRGPPVSRSPLQRGQAAEPPSPRRFVIFPPHTRVAPTKQKRRRSTRRPSPIPNGAATDGSDSDRSVDLKRLFTQTEDKTASALLRVAGAIETLAEAAQAQAAAARATAEGMEMIARAVTEALTKSVGRDGSRTPTDAEETPTGAERTSAGAEEAPTDAAARLGLDWADHIAAQETALESDQ